MINVPAILLAMTAVSGIVDAVSFLSLGHVFTANMTGNIVFLGFAVAGAPGLSVPRSLAALAGFLLGTLLGCRFATFLSTISVRKWTTTAFGLEGIVLLAATLASIRLHASEVIAVYAVIVLTAVAMGIRNATVRKLSVADLTTTALTLT